MKRSHFLIGLWSLFVFILLSKNEVIAQDWKEVQKLYPNDLFTYSSFGYKIAATDNQLVVTSFLQNAAYIYERLDDHWFQTQKIVTEYTPGNYVNYRFFGHSISMSDSLMVIGAHEYDANPDEYNSKNVGAIVIYEKKNNRWVMSKTIVNPTQKENAFGKSVSLYGNYCLVTGDGLAYIYEKTADGWVSQKLELTLNHPYTWDLYGECALYGDYAMIQNNAILRGGVSVFKRENSGWVEKTFIPNIHSNNSEAFGNAIELKDDQALICSKKHAYIYKKQGENWIQGINLLSLIPNGLMNSWETAYNCSLEDNYAIVTTVRCSYLFRRDAANNWNFIEEINIGNALEVLLKKDFIFGGNHYDDEIYPAGGSVTVLGRQSSSNTLKGTVYLDSIQSCQREESESGLKGILLKAEPGPFYTTTNVAGNYQFRLPKGNYTISQVLPENRKSSITKSCPLTYEVNFEGNNKDTTGFDFGNHTESCSLLKVDVNSNRRRRCFRNQTVVSYCNEGLLPAEDVEIQVNVPEYVIPLSSTYAWTAQNDKTYTFYIGDLAPGQCGSFTITDSVACIAGITGNSQCTEAKIFPKNNCASYHEGWNGASLSMTGKCIVLFDPIALIIIRNNGTADMNSASEFRIFGSDTLIYQGNTQLAAGDSLVLEISKQDKIIRVELDQVSGHPEGKLISVEISDECNSSPMSAKALAMQFPAADEAAEIESQCLFIIDSFDPNDKQVHPIGFTNNHYVRPGTDLEYTIRFQNTGSAEAVNILVIDTLSADLDMNQFQMMSASHDYQLQVSGQERPVLTWIFNNINLPDSTTREPDSHGYIKFKIKALDGIAEGIIIENFADIYFDFNEPVRTNTTVTNITDYQFPQALIDFCTMVRKAEAGEDQTICQNFTTLQGNTPTMGQGTWSVINGSGVFADIHNPTTQVIGLTPGENIFKWTIHSDGCIPSESTLKITLPFASQAHAGTDKTICDSNIILEGNIPEVGQGKWTVLKGSGILANSLDPGTQVNNLTYGENIFQWNVGNGLCDSTRSQVIITRLHESSPADAGQDTNICADTYTLAGNLPQYGQGIWTKISGSGDIINPQNPQAIVENIAVGESIFEWTIHHGICTSSRSQVKITRLPPQENSVSITVDRDSTCPGEAVTFTAIPTNGGENPIFEWIINMQRVATGTSNTFTTSQLQNGDEVFVSMQADITCSSRDLAIAYPIQMTIYPKPTHPEILHVQHKLLKSSVLGDLYNWYKDGVPLDIHTDTLLVEELGTYELEVVGEHCISEKSVAFQLNEVSLGRFANLDKVMIFPNPNEGIFSLQIPNNAGSIITLELWDKQGKLILKNLYPASKWIDFKEEIQIPKVLSGVYILKIQNHKGTVYKRIVVL